VAGARGGVGAAGCVGGARSAAAAAVAAAVAGAGVDVWAAPGAGGAQGDWAYAAVCFSLVLGGGGWCSGVTIAALRSEG
jgi:hypothetical protein